MYSFIIPGKKLLISYMPVRWNTFYSMVNRAREMKDPMVLFSASYKDCEKLSTEEWDLIEELTIIFKPLYSATLELSAEKFTTLSKVLPLTNKLLAIYGKANPDDSPKAKEVRKTIYEGLKNQFKDVESNEMICNATLFDPRFKDYFFKKTKRTSAILAAKLDAVREATIDADGTIDEDDDTSDMEEQATLDKEVIIEVFIFALLSNAHQYVEVRN